MLGLDKFGDGIGLHRIIRFCRLHDIDMEFISARSIVVTGSKGKGSTARFIYSILRDVLPHVGCFTSPHLYTLLERFEHDGAYIARGLFDHHLNRALAFAQQLRGEGDRLGQFELLFLIALGWFNDLRPDCIVWEAGIGGRYDPVRVLGAVLGVLTSVEFEHTDLLGSSLEQIAFDKVDAIAPGGRIFVSPSVSSALHERLQGFGCVARKNLTFVADEIAITDIDTTVARTKFDARFKDRTSYSVTLGLLGSHQVCNAATALAAADAFLKSRAIGAPMATLIEAIAHSKLPGRMEQLAVSPDIWIDVGHTPESVRTVCDEFVRLFAGRKILAVFGVSYNKSIAEIVQIVDHRFDNVILTRAHKNGTDPAALAPYFSNHEKILALTNSIEEAVAMVRALTTHSDQTVVVVGGLFLAVEFATAWRGQDPRSLAFF